MLLQIVIHTIFHLLYAMIIHSFNYTLLHPSLHPSIHFIFIDFLGADINAQTEETQETALTLACCGGFLEVADFLIKVIYNIKLE